MNNLDNYGLKWIFFPELPRILEIFLKLIPWLYNRYIVTKLFAFGNISRPTQNYIMALNSGVTSITRHASNIQYRIITGYTCFSHLSATI